VVKDAPRLLVGAPSAFSYKDANVTGAVSFSIRLDTRPPATEQAVSGLLVGQVIKSANSARANNDDGVMLVGYIVSADQYKAWMENKQKLPGVNVGEVELRITGNALTGYTLIGDIRSADVCGNARPVAPGVQDLTGAFGRGVPAKWSARVTLKHQ